MATTYSVAASSDDAAQHGDSSWSLTDVTNNINAGAGATDTNWFYCRFTNIVIPRGAIITSAKLRLYAFASKTLRPNMNIYQEAIDNPATFSTQADIISRSDTPPILWAPGADVTVNAYCDTVDISAAVQAVVNRAGWASGNAMAFELNALSTTDKLSVHAFDNATNPPQFVVDFIVPSLRVVRPVYKLLHRLRSRRGRQWQGVRGGIEQTQGLAPPPVMQDPALYGSRRPIPRQHRPAQWFANPSGTTATGVVQPFPAPNYLQPIIDGSRKPIPRLHRPARWFANIAAVLQTQSLSPPPMVLRVRPSRSNKPIPRQHRGARWWSNRTGISWPGFIRPQQKGSRARPMLEIAFASSVTDEPPVWTDVSERLREGGLHPRRGRSQELQQFSAGKLTVQLDDRDRAFDTLNMLSPYYPNVDINKPVRLRAEYPWLPGLIPNPNFDGSDGAGSLVGWSVIGSGTTNLDATQHYVGNNSVRFTATATQAEAGVRTDPIAVEGGQMAVWSFRGRPAAGTENLKMRFEWFYDLAATQPLSTDYGPITPSPSGTWTRASGPMVTVPPSAMSVRISLLLDAVTNGDVIYFDTAVFDYGTFQGIFPMWYGYLDKLAPRVEGLDRVTELEATDAFALFTLARMVNTGYSAIIKAGMVWDIFGTLHPPTSYWRLGDPPPLFGFQDEYNVASLTALGNVNPGQPGAIAADVDTAAQFQANPGGFAFTIGPAFTNVKAGVFECWLKWTDTGQALMSYVGIASQSLIIPLPGWQTSPLFIAMAGDGALDKNFQAVPRGSLCVFKYSFDGVNDHFDQAWGKTVASRIPGDSKWHHVMVSLSGTNTLSACVDGVPVGAGSVSSSNLPSGIDFGAAGLLDQTFILSPIAHFGNTMEGIPFAGIVQGWDGNIDEVAVYDYGASGPLGITGAALAHYKAGAGQWAGQTPGQRINSILDTITWPTARRNVGIDTQPALQPVDATLTQTDALSYMQTMESNDLGYLFMSGDGKLTFVTRQQLIGATYGAIKTVFGNEPIANSTEVPFEIAEPFVDQMILFNQAEVQQAGGATFIYKDAASIAKYWTRVVQASGMVMANVIDAVYMAQWLVGHYKVPETRIEPLVLNPISQDAVWKAVLQRDIGDLVEVRDRLRVLSGYRSYTMRVQGISHDITADKWTCSLSLTSADAQRFFTLNDPSLGQLSAGNRLAW